MPVHVVADAEGLTLTFPTCDGDRVQMLAVYVPGSGVPRIAQVQPGRVAGDSLVSVRIDEETLGSGTLVSGWDSTSSVALPGGDPFRPEQLQIALRIYTYETSFDVAGLPSVTSGSYLVEGGLGTNSNLTITEISEESAGDVFDDWCESR